MPECPRAVGGSPCRRTPTPAPNASHRFEAVQSFSDDSLTECPECAGRLRKVFSNVGIVFKGSGFYRTDSRKEGGADTSESTGTKDGASKNGGSKDGATKEVAAKNGSSTGSGPKSDSGSGSQGTGSSSASTSSPAKSGSSAGSAA